MKETELKEKLSKLYQEGRLNKQIRNDGWILEAKLIEPQKIVSEKNVEILERIMEVFREEGYSYAINFINQLTQRNNFIKFNKNDNTAIILSNVGSSIELKFCKEEYDDSPLLDWIDGGGYFYYEYFVILKDEENNFKTYKVKGGNYGIVGITEVIDEITNSMKYCVEYDYKIDNNTCYIYYAKCVYNRKLSRFRYVLNVYNIEILKTVKKPLIDVPFINTPTKIFREERRIERMINTMPYDRKRILAKLIEEDIEKSDKIAYLVAKTPQAFWILIPLNLALLSLFDLHIPFIVLRINKHFRLAYPEIIRDLNRKLEHLELGDKIDIFLYKSAILTIIREGFFGL
jgi:hypothetical protein